MRLDPTPSQARQQICDVLAEAGITAHNGIAEQFVPPCVIVGPASTYLAPSTFGQWQIGHKVVVVAPPGTNATQADELDATIVEVLTYLDAAGYATSPVTAPGRLDSGHLAADLTVTSYTNVVHPDDPVTHYVTPEV